MGEANVPTFAQPEPSADFEALLWSIFLRLMDVPGDRVDTEILNAQRQLCLALDLDRSALWQTRPEAPGTFFVTHVYTAEHDGQVGALTDGSLPGEAGREFRLFDSRIRKHADASDYFEWVVQRARERLTTVITSLDDLPAEAIRDAESFRRFGTRSTVLVPLTVQEEVLGCLSFATARTARQWEPALVMRFERLAQVFAKALAKKRADELLRDREAHLQLALDSADAGVWDLEIATGRIRANEVTRRLFGFERDDEFDFARAVAVIHPDDRQRVLDAIEWGRAHGGPYEHECRVCRPDGTTIWVYSRGRPFSAVTGEPPQRVIGVSIDITERKQTESQLRGALDELDRLRERLEHENLYLRREIRERRTLSEIVGTSAAIRRTLDLVEQVAPTRATVLVTGETGTGKERVAAAIHELSPRGARPMVNVNCAAVPATLIESELFGREKGAYTGALSRQIGRFELANGSTIFLDEIGDLPLETQGKLLRVLEAREFERLGSPNPIHVDVRIIAATNRDLEEAVRDGRFRRDLYYRLNVFPITVPPLRERLEDLPLLAKVLADEMSTAMGKRVDAIERSSLATLQRYHWPGNVRELRNVIERAIITADGPVLHIEPPVAPALRRERAARSLKALEREHILETLRQTGWRIRGPRGAAAQLGLPPTTLENRMARLGIVRPGK